MVAVKRVMLSLIRRIRRRLGHHISALLSTHAKFPATGFLRQPQVLTFIPISKSTLWQRALAGTFPAPLLARVLRHRPTFAPPSCTRSLLEPRLLAAQIGGCSSIA